MINPNRPTGKLVVMALLAAVAQASGITLTDDTIYRMTMCDLCAQGVPLVNGKHIILGAEIPCDAEEEK